MLSSEDYLKIPKPNLDCYEVKTINNKNGIFDSIADITYIITMKNGNERHKKMYQQLEWFHPTKEVNIWYNEGYRRCEKLDENGNIIDISYKDLTFTVMNIFQDALMKGFTRILVLEDDFVVSEKILDQHIQKDIADFILKNDPHIYYLGCFPYIITPNTIISTHYKLFAAGSNHAVIYSNNAMLKLLKRYYSTENFKRDIDVMTMYDTSQFTYHIPMINQYYPETENKRTWGADVSQIEKAGITIHKWLINKFSLDKENNIETNTRKFYLFITTVNKLIYMVMLVILFRRWGERPTRYI